MSAYTELRAKQKARSHIVGAEGAMRKIAPLHRSTLVDDEADRVAADERQGLGPLPKVTKPSKAERTEVAKFWRVASWAGIAVFSFLLLLHWGVSK